MSTTLLSGLNPFLPISVARVPSGETFIATGISPAQRWDGVSSATENAGIPAGVNGSFAGSWGTAGAISGVYSYAFRYLDDEGIPGDLSPLQSATAASHSTISYSAVPVSSDSRVTQRQIWRSTAGQSITLYLDATIADNVTTTATSTKNDATLAALTALPILNPDGSVNARRFGVPPATKRQVLSHLGRTFWLANVTYDQGHIEVTNGSASVTGQGTSWTSSMAGRKLHVVNHASTYTISAVNTTTQVLTLSVVFSGTTDKFATYAIKVDPSEYSLVYWSYDGEPESVYALNADELDGTQDGEITGGFTLGSMLYVGRERQIRRWTFLADPAIDGGTFQAANRGMLHERVVTQFDGQAAIMDAEGIYFFNGGTVDPRSSLIQTYFRQGKIHWARKQWFHAFTYEAEETVRFWVCLTGSDYPRHALAYHYRQGKWWEEAYPFEVSASVTAPVNGQLRLLMGGPHERILLAQEGTLDGPSESLTARTDVASATLMSITVTAPEFTAADILGSTVAIVAGPGKGQERRILTASASTGLLEIDRPWMEMPTTKSTAQIAGVGWRWKSGWFKHVQIDQENERSLQVCFQQTEKEGSIDIRRYVNHETVPVNEAAEHDGYDGVTTVLNKPDNTIATKRRRGIGSSSGWNKIHWDTTAPMEGGASDRFVQIELRGWQNQDPTVIHSLTLVGVEK